MTLLQQFELDLNQVRQQIERGLDILSGKVTEEKDWIEKELEEEKSKVAKWD